MVVSEYFKPVELVSPETHYRFGDNVWFLFDPRLLQTIDWARGVCGPLIANNWASKTLVGKKFTCRGFREVVLQAAAGYSAHYRGQALDAHSIKHSAERLRSMLIDAAETAPHPFRLEIGVNWLHIDVANVNYENNRVVLFRG